MASHSAFKIRIVHEAYINFFATIRTGESPEQLADQVKTELEFPRDAPSSDLRIHSRLSGQACGEEEKSDWSIFYRPQPAACDLTSEKL